MLKFILGLVAGVGIGFALSQTGALSDNISLEHSATEGVYVAYPLQLQTSLDFRDDGTMFMAAQSTGEWFTWEESQKQIHAIGTGSELKGKILIFEKKNDDLFLQNLRFSKQN